MVFSENKGSFISIFSSFTNSVRSSRFGSWRWYISTFQYSSIPYSIWCYTLTLQQVVMKLVKSPWHLQTWSAVNASSPFYRMQKSYDSYHEIYTLDALHSWIIHLMADACCACWVLLTILRYALSAVPIYVLGNPLYSLELP